MYFHHSLSILVLILPKGEDAHNSNSALSFPSQEKRASRIRQSIRHAWKGYKEYAMGYDELLPLSRIGQNNWKGFGLTVIESLDTLALAGLDKEYEEAKNWLVANFTWEKNDFVSVFEITIRALGGLLSSYHLTNDGRLLELAIDFGHRVSHAFSSPFGKS